MNRVFYSGTFKGRLVKDNFCEHDGNGYGYIQLERKQEGTHGTTKVFVHASDCSSGIRALIDRERHDEFAMKIRGSRPGGASDPSHTWDLPEHLLVFEMRPRKKGPRAIEVRFTNETSPDTSDYEDAGDWADMIDLDESASEHYDCA
jgi:hypothetical protein